MHRDPTLRKRNALVIPGVLLLIASLAGIAYVQLVRDDSGTCEDGQRVVLAGACRSATLLLVIPLAIGVLLAGLGAAQRKKGSCHLGHGTAATTTLVVLATAFGLAILATLAVYAMDDADDPYVIPYGDTDFGMAAALGGLTLALALAFVPYLALYLGTRRPPRCCRDKQCFEPCFCDEEPEVPIPTFPVSTTAPGPAAPLPATPDNAQVTMTPWAGKPARDVAPLPPVGKEPPAPPPAPEAPKALVHDAWPSTHGEPEPAPASAPPMPPAPAPPVAEKGKAAPAKAKPAAGKKTRKVKGKKAK